MIHRQVDFRVETREAMRGGKGRVTIEHFWNEAEEMKSPIRMCARLILEPGCSIGFHRHDSEEELFYIISGCAEADDNGKICALGAGESMLTGNGAGHAIANAGSEPLTILAVITRY